MFRRFLLFIFLGLFVGGCSRMGWEICTTWVDAAFVTREFDEQTGEMHLLLEVDEETLAGAQRPVALFLIPQQVEQTGFRYGQYWEKVDPQSELGELVLAAATAHLGAQELPESASCRELEDGTLSGCNVIMVTMNGLVGSCCKYSLAYSASIYLPISEEAESEILVGVVILDDSENRTQQCSQVVFP